MKNIKEKLLQALDCSLDDISEERLIDILLDAYNSKKQRIVELEGENSRERVMLHTEREQIRDERHQMHTNPLYGASGQYYFVLDNKKFVVQIEGGRRIQLFERQAQIDFAAQPLTSKEFASR